MKMKKMCAAWMTLLCLSSAGLGADPQTLLKGVSHRASGALVQVRCQIKEEIESRTVAGVGICIEKSGLFVTMGLDARIRPDTITKLEVVLPGAEGKSFPAKLLSIDALTGLSFLQVSGAHKWSVVSFQGKSNLSVGDPVVSIGLQLNDPALTPTAGLAYVADKRRTPAWRVSVTGGTLSPVGSVVFNAAGQAIGLVGGQPFQRCQTLSQRGAVSLPLRAEDRTVAFIPVEEFAYVLSNIPQDGKVRRLPWIGVGRFMPVSKDLAEAKGVGTPAVMIDQIIPGRAADKAGLKNRDIIVGFNGSPLEKLASPSLVSENFVRNLMRSSGNQVTLTVLSGGKTRTVTLPLEPLPKLANEAKRDFHRSIGLLVREKVLLDRYLDKTPAAEADGVLVVAVARRGPAANAGLQVGDVITVINGRAVNTVDPCREIIDKALSKKPPMDLTLTVLRGSGSEKIVIQAPTE
jgi:serine protease Do